MSESAAVAGAAAVAVVAAVAAVVAVVSLATVADVARVAVAAVAGIAARWLTGGLAEVDLRMPVGEPGLSSPRCRLRLEGVAEGSRITVPGVVFVESDSPVGARLARGVKRESSVSVGGERGGL